MKTTFLFLAGALAIPAVALPASKALLEQTEILHGGKDGYMTYRIPAVIISPGGDLLAFAEGRKDTIEDSGDIDVLLKRSSDRGKTWSAYKVIADQGADTIGNTCPVVDLTTKTIFLLLTANSRSLNKRQLIDGILGTRTVWITKSTDDGKTWSAPAEITTQVKDSAWGWVATGPGNGIQLSSGRLIVPSNHRVKGNETPISYVMYSDDHGGTWKKGADVGENTNESQVVELADGSLMINARSYAGKSRRAVAISHDGGLSWSPVRLDETLVEPICQASIFRLSKGRLLFSNPNDPKQRRNLTVRLSNDDGKTWPVSRVLDPGPAAYSSLVLLPDRTIGCLYEKGPSRGDNSLVFARFNLEWLKGN
jgi:sialidase-1